MSTHWAIRWAKKSFWLVFEKLRKVGEKSALKVGDKVMCLFPGASHAQFAAVDSRHCLPIPVGYSMETAGGIMEVWLTAFQLLYKVGSIKEGDVVFVHAAASGGEYCLLRVMTLNKGFPYKRCSFIWLQIDKMANKGIIDYPLFDLELSINGQNLHIFLKKK